MTATRAAAACEARLRLACAGGLPQPSRAAVERLLACGTPHPHPSPPRRAVSKLGPYYEPIKGVGTKRGRSIFADSEIDGVPSTTELTKLQVYVGVWPEGERIPFAGAIPFAIE